MIEAARKIEANCIYSEQFNDGTESFGLGILKMGYLTAIIAGNCY